MKGRISYMKYLKRCQLCLLFAAVLLFSSCAKKDVTLKDDHPTDVPLLYPTEAEVKEDEPAFDEIENTDPDAVEVTNERPVLNSGTTLTGLEPLNQISYYVSDPLNMKGLSDEKISHSFGVAQDGQPHSITVENQKRFDEWQHNALTWDNKSEEKVLYLTFDCGYEYENLTDKILDTLKEKGVTAAFFCTMDYLRDAPEFVTRMIQEGHIVGNHSTTHPSDSSSLSREKMAWELLGVHNYLRVNFGYRSHYFRFPTGTYSEDMLELVDSVGYRSVFWSIAHTDWDPQNQPGQDKSFETVTNRLHPGAVILLHACSPDNAAILGRFIDYAREQGYEFRSLDEYPYWDN